MHLFQFDLFFAALSAAALAFVGTELAAQQKTRPGVIGVDDRKLVSRSDTISASVGRLNITGFSKKRRCTGTLIAKDRVVTAANCLVDGHGNKKPMDQINFVSAVRRGSTLVHAKAKCVHLAKSPYVHEWVFAPKLINNIAVIVLEKELDLPTIPLAQSFSAEPGTSLTHASYPNSRNPVLRVHHACELFGQEHGLLKTNCDTTAFSPGGPVLIKAGSQLKLVAVMAGFFSGQFTVGVPAYMRTTLLRDQPCP